MPNNNNKNQQKKKQFESEVKQLFGGDLTQEVRQLIDLAVRKEFNTQDFVDRLTNTKYFRKSFPGLLDHDGTITNALTGEQGVGVSASSLTGAIKNYRTALNQNQQTAQQYGYNFGKGQLAKLLQDQTSADEFKARLAAVETVDANPALKAAFEAQQRALGIKVNAGSAYKAAVAMGDKKFSNLYEGALFQDQLGLSRGDAASLAKGSAIPVGATFDDIGQLVSEVRSNLQGYAPELANQGIDAARLVKVLGNPTAFAADIEKIKAVAQQRAALGRPVAGSYGQQGQAGLSQYPSQREQSYG
jgi:hypothetical protein